MPTESVQLLSISEADLRTAFTQWEQNFRDGKTRSVEETAALPIEQVASESAACMFRDLERITSPQTAQA